MWSDFAECTFLNRAKVARKGRTLKLESKGEEEGEEAEEETEEEGEAKEEESKTPGPRARNKNLSGRLEACRDGAVTSRIRRLRRRGRLRTEEEEEEVLLLLLLPIPVPAPIAMATGMETQEMAGDGSLSGGIRSRRARAWG